MVGGSNERARLLGCVLSHRIIPGTPTLGVGNISVSDRAAQPSSGDTAKLIHFIRAYQDRGHEYADLDPLGLRREAVQLLGETSKIVPEDYGFTEADLERGMDLSGMESANIEGVMAHADLNSDGQTTLSELKASSTIHTATTSGTSMPTLQT